MAVGWLLDIFRKSPRCDFCGKKMDAPSGIVVIKAKDNPFEMRACSVCWAVMELHRD